MFVSYTMLSLLPRSIGSTLLSRYLRPRRLAIFAAKVSAVAAGVAISYVCIRRVVAASRPVLSRYLYSKRVAPHPLGEMVLRSEFKGLEIIKHPDEMSCTHPQSAGSRSTASHFFSRYADLLGLDILFVQGSNADLRNGRAISRDYFWDKDYTVPPQAENVDYARTVQALVDVDYYVNMPERLLVSYPSPILIYGFSPHHAAGCTQEFSYWFNKDHSVTYLLNGGMMYSHYLWDYSPDTVRVVGYTLGVPTRVSVYKIDRRPLGTEHEMTLLTPIASWRGSAALIAYFLTQGVHLERFDPIVGDFVRVYRKFGGSYEVSTGIVGKSLQCTVPVEVDEAISSVARTSSLALTQATTLSYMNPDERESLRPGSAVLLEFHRSITDRGRYVYLASHNKGAHVFPIQEGVQHTQKALKDYDEDAKPTMVPFMHPFINGAYAPDRTRANEQFCIDERITKVSNVNNSEVTVTRFLDKMTVAFVSCLVDEQTARTYHPFDDDEVYARQIKPTQRALLEQAQNETPFDQVRLNMKAETYGGADKAPRPISVIDKVRKLEYAKFMYVVSDLLKETRWYAFGKPPIELAESVAALLTNANNVALSDFSKFDGHVSIVFRLLERRLLLRLFRPEYHHQLIELHNAHFRLTGKSTFGVKFASGDARLSGGMDTSSFNSIGNAFVNFLALVSQVEDGVKRTPMEAYTRLGLYGGDDGLTPNVSAKDLVRVSKMVGMKVDVIEIPRGVGGVNFLARIYSPEVWFGSTNTCCDLPRQLTKFHVTQRLSDDVTPEMKLREKVRAFYMTDRNTPYFGQFLKKAVDIMQGVPEVEDRTLQIRKWNSDLPEDKQYPNEYEEWMYDYANTSLGRFNFDAIYFMRQIEAADSIDDLLEIGHAGDPIEPSPATETVVNGNVYKMGVVAHRPRPLPEVAGDHSENLHNDSNDGPFRGIEEYIKVLKPSAHGTEVVTKLRPSSVVRDYNCPRLVIALSCSGKTTYIGERKDLFDGDWSHAVVSVYRDYRPGDLVRALCSLLRRESRPIMAHAELHVVHRLVAEGFPRERVVFYDIPLKLWMQRMRERNIDDRARSNCMKDWEEWRACTDYVKAGSFDDCLDGVVREPPTVRPARPKRR